MDGSLAPRGCLVLIDAPPFMERRSPERHRYENQLAPGIGRLMERLIAEVLPNSWTRSIVG